jgi:acetyl-CoA carboxylase biotin carboxylase subunit
LHFAPVVPTFRSARGHAIECRIYAEDPEQGFLPSPGRITHLRAASGPGIRDDSGATVGWVVPTSYDPLVAKVIAWGPDRATAIARMVRALGEYDIRGIKTTIGFCRWLLETPAFRAGAFDTTSVDRLIGDYCTGAGERDAELEEIAAIAAAFHINRAGKVPQPPAVRAIAESLWARRARLESLR